MYVLEQNLFFIIVNGDGDYLSFNDDKLFFTKDYNSAHFWSKREKAKNFLTNSLTHNPDCYIKPIKRNKTVNKHFLDDSVLYEIISSNNDDICYIEISEWMNQLQAKTSGFDIDKIKKISCQTSNDLSQMDKMIIDIYHYIEFGEFNAYQGWKLFKILQMILRQRRSAKDILYVFHDNCGNIISNSSKILSRANELKGRGYTPRLLKSMFIK